SGGHRLMAGHNGYVPTHGLTHIRQIMLSIDGRAIAGEDTLGAMTVADRRRFETIMARTKHQGVPFALRFHLHPDVDCALDLGGHRLMAGHNGYVPTHGLTHIRQIMLSIDGRAIAGEDTLGAMTVADRRRFETIMARTKHQGVPFALRFHLHPDVDCALDLGG